jgi:DNA repair exonuclease SbcCD ATPase subunit
MATSLEELKQEYARLLGRKETLAESFESLDKQIENLLDEKVLLTQCLELLGKAASVSRAQIKEHIEKVVSYVLQQILEREDYVFSLEFVRKRNQIEVYPLLNELPVLDGHGGGPSDLIAIVLRLTIKHQMQVSGPVLFDEPAKFLGGVHRPFFMAMLREFSQRTGTQMILISHVPEYLKEANRGVIVEQSNGVSRVKNV